MAILENKRENKRQKQSNPFTPRVAQKRLVVIGDRIRKSERNEELGFEPSFLLLEFFFFFSHCPACPVVLFGG